MAAEIQEISKTDHQIVLSRMGLHHSRLTHFLPLHFPKGPAPRLKIGLIYVETWSHSIEAITSVLSQDIHGNQLQCDPGSSRSLYNPITSRITGGERATSV